MNKIEFVALGYCSNDHLCRIPEIPVDSKIEMTEHMIQGGGPAGDAAVGAARLGLSTAFVTSLGDDLDGKLILSDFAAEGVNTSAIQVRQGGSSPIAYGWITPDGKRSVAWTKNNLELLKADEIPSELIRNAKMLHLDGHHPDAAVAAAKVAKDAGTLINLDAGTFTPRIDELLDLADILICSEFFARKWSGENNLEKALVKLKTLGAKVTGVTAGSEGSMLITDSMEILRCPAFNNLPVVDSTGAGDAYHCGFGVRYLETDDLQECMRFASAFAGIKCGKLGGRAGLPSRKVVDEFLKNN
ncbi:MAG: PfkB family carbohydrate kinase [Victivallales bacterium]|jgi:ribokinase|nr:PfkB family carbohydrate kinase [Victivallales bacterium]